MATFVVTVEASGGYLACPREQTDRSVTLATGKNNAQWTLTPAGAKDVYVISATGRQSGPAILSCSPDGSRVDLFERDDGSGRQQWTLKNLSARIFTLAVEKGLPSGPMFLTAGSDGLSLKPRLPAGGGAATQQFKVLELSSTPAKTSSAVFVGGAFLATQHDLAHDAGGWPTVAAQTGYWCHPMGMAVARDQGWLPTLLSRFGKKRFVYEQDLLAWSDGTNPTQTTTPSCWGDWLKQSNPAFECEFYCPWVAGDRLAKFLDDTTNRYIAIRERMDRAGYASKGYFFYAPPCPESIVNADTLLGARKNGMSYVEYVVRTAGLKGICVDFPAGLWLSQHFPAQFPPNSGDKCRQLAKQAHDVARSCGVPFVWVFNGSDACITPALDSIKAAGIKIDVVGVDNFADSQRKGTPETSDTTVSGQAFAALRWLKTN